MYKHMFRLSWLTSSNYSYLNNLYKKFLLDPDSISNSWKTIFQELSKNNHLNLESTTSSLHSKKQNHNNIVLAIKLINLFRTIGYKFANINPLTCFKNSKKFSWNTFLKKNNNFDLQAIFSINLSKHVLNNINLEILFSHLKKIYSNTIGYQYMHIDNTKERKWIQNYIENRNNEDFLKNNEKIKLFKNLIISETLEQYFSAKFPGSKRFSIEGSETLIPILKEIIHYTQKFNVNKIIFGMPHRGRLNVLANILNKPIENIFNEFFENNLNFSHSGDVKYHMGFNYIKKIGLKKIILELKSNPSHLEIINPVVIGSSRAYIESHTNLTSNNVLPIIIHGDAAISGQGVVQELLNMSQVRGYEVGGSIHIVIDNQIGFTTSQKKDLRTSEYCTDIAKMIDAPIFHINANDPESSIFIIRLALDYRFYFKKDVFINLTCYRRHGHNEIDNPKVTQPLMYSKIDTIPTVVNIYNKKLLLKKIIDENYLKNYKNSFKTKIDISYNLCKSNYVKYDSNKFLLSNSNKFKVLDYSIKNISIDNLKLLAKKIFYLPLDISLHNRVFKIYQDRLDMANEQKLFDWSSAELLAYASLLNHGISCRLSGEDVCRGTFFQRHAVIYDQKNNSEYIPLNHINSNQGKFYIWNSVLSEEAALAFEYGYSIEQKNILNIWEAQFGDFANGAQIVIDQFICSGEQKWNITCNLIIFLPHGYEGQGPEHSSARIERYLQLSSDNNIRVVIPTTAFQIYHIIRQQALCKIKKPLIIMSPKSILRLPLTFSSFSEFSNSKFKEVIDEIDIFDNNKVKKIILCSGKIYYDLLVQRRFNKQTNIAILRIEQLYPFPTQKLLKIFKTYKHVKNFIWCQEEPLNQGAWYYSKLYLKKILPKMSILNYIGRPESSSTATGYSKVHQKQQKTIINNALNID